MISEILLAALFLIVSLSISLCITVPLIGVLIRYRANYTPKGLHLDQEGGVQPHVGPVVNGYWAMFMRVKRLEGIQGFFKGLVPTLLSTTMLTVFAATLMGASFANPKTPGGYGVPDSNHWVLLLYSAVVTLLAIPFTLLTNRAIVTPRRLKWFSPRLACQALLTPVERRKPWKLYLIPGLLATQSIHILYVILILHTFRGLILPSFSGIETGMPLPQDITLTRFAVYFVGVLVSTTVLCPLEVVATRLSLQRSNAGSSDFSELAQEEQGVDADEGIEFSGQEEDVVGLRSDEDPYVGMVDCINRIKNEEGVKVLYRAWHCSCVYYQDWNRLKRPKPGNPAPAVSRAVTLQANNAVDVPPATASPRNTLTSTAGVAASVSEELAAATTSLSRNAPRPSEHAQSSLAFEEEAKLVYGVILSLRNMVKKISGRNEQFVNYRTSTYKLHFLETLSGYKFVLLSHPSADPLRPALRQLYAGPFLEFVVRNPLVKMDTRDRGIDNEYFRVATNKLIRSLPAFT